MKVLNIKDCEYKIPDGAVYVGRAMRNLPASKWGNPFKIGIDGTREEVIAKYRIWLTCRLESPKLIRVLQHELKGHDLVCWCHNWDGEGKNPNYCHADILLELATLAQEE